MDLWLRSLQLACYSEHFRRAGFASLDAIRSVTLDDLLRVGVASTDHQKTLLDAARHLALC